MITTPLRTATLLIALGLAVAGCGSTTGGSGSVAAAGGGGAGTHRPDFPSASPSAAAPTSAPATAPVPTGSDEPGTHPVPSAPLRVVRVNAASGPTYVVKLWAEVKDATCFDHAYGRPVINFLTTHPCTGLTRLLGTTTVKGRPVGFAVSETGFQGPTSDPYKYAGQFMKLEEQDGTGSIADLLREGYRLPSGPSAIPADEAFNVLGQDVGVVIWDAWYLDGPTPNNDPALMAMTQDLFLQF